MKHKINTVKQLGYAITIPVNNWAETVNVNVWDNMPDSVEEYYSWLKNKHNVHNEEDMLNHISDSLFTIVLNSKKPADKQPKLSHLFRRYEDNGNYVLMITPIGADKDWLRENNLIDIAEFWNQETPSPETYNKTIFHDYSPFPYTGRVNLETKEIVPTCEYRLAAELVKQYNENNEEAPLLQKMLTRLGVSDVGKFNEIFIPVIPEEIIEVCEWLNFFVNPDTVYKLRPALRIHSDIVK